MNKYTIDAGRLPRDLRALQRLQHYSQAVLAAEMGIGGRTVYCLENGDPVGTNVIKKIAGSDYGFLTVQQEPVDPVDLLRALFQAGRYGIGDLAPDPRTVATILGLLVSIGLLPDEYKKTADLAARLLMDDVNADKHF